MKSCKHTFIYLLLDQSQSIKYSIPLLHKCVTPHKYIPYEFSEIQKDSPNSITLKGVDISFISVLDTLKMSSSIVFERKFLKL